MATHTTARKQPNYLAMTFTICFVCFIILIQFPLIFITPILEYKKIILFKEYNLPINEHVEYSVATSLWIIVPRLWKLIEFNMYNIQLKNLNLEFAIFWTCMLFYGKEKIITIVYSGNKLFFFMLDNIRSLWILGICSLLTMICTCCFVRQILKSVIIDEKGENNGQENERKIFIES
ncbi:hypothetical protein RhiirA5_395008 [Rhizophagus irregularis]|uniref:Uncharacterized protein n=1 Tax=Rhizophagus irregularis TaxID=588596 RepID=A0A2I1DYL4_9GLOM|nr:hypothetical protein RhiirA5_395008 [Rhizophagus irregularis]PKY14965.1 hypothetical protein RhiirB3_466405 [Rhizophagus irregularis]